MNRMRDRFDFEIGYLIKSPCRGCACRDRFPACMPDCTILDRLQTRLARGISSSRSDTTSGIGAYGWRLPDTT